MAVFFFFAYSEFLSDFFTGGPDSVGVRSLDFKFIRECIKIKKIHRKSHFFDKNGNKNDLPCIFVLFFTVSSPLEPFGSRFIDV